jgi:hypothetical protein
VTKVLTIRIEWVAEKLILQNKSAFMKGINIMYGIMTLHEVLHETKRNQEVGIILKLDFEKAYDKICWEFLFESLRLRGFHEKWCGWIKDVVTGTVAVKINKKVGPYFLSKKGVRQGDPLSPILFNMAADCLTRMVRKAQENNLIIGLADKLIPKGVAILQYADDTIICLKNDDEVARNMKLLPFLYKIMSGLKINFNKSEVIIILGDEERGNKLLICSPVKWVSSPSNTWVCLSAQADYTSEIGPLWKKKV